MNRSPRRGDIWTNGAGTSVLVISSTVYNEIPSEPTVIVVPVFDTDPTQDSEWVWAKMTGQHRVW